MGRFASSARLKPWAPRPPIADHRQHVAVVGPRDEYRALEGARRKTSAAFRGGQLPGEHPLGRRLHTGIEGGEDPEPFGAQVAITVVAGELAAHEVHERRMGRGAAGRFGPYSERTRLGGGGLCAADDAASRHHVENQIAAPKRPFGPPPRIVRGGAAGEPHEKRGLGQIELVDPAAEIEPRCKPEAVDRPPPFLAEIHLVEIHLEQLLLGVAGVQQQGHDRLGELARQRTFGREKEVLRELLGERAPPLHDGRRAHVRPRGARDGEEGDPVMVEEPMILDGDQPRDEHRGRIVEPDHHPVLVVAGIDAADEGRVQPHDRGGSSARVEGAHHAGVEPDLDPARRLHRIPEAELSGFDDEPVARAEIASGPVRAVLPVVSRAPEFILQRVGGQPGPRPQLDGAGIYAGGQRPALALELGPDADVEPDRIAGREDENEDRRPPRERPKKPPAAAPRAPPAPRRLRLAAGRRALRRLRSRGPGAGPGSGGSFAGPCHRRPLSPNTPVRTGPVGAVSFDRFRRFLAE